MSDPRRNPPPTPPPTTPNPSTPVSKLGRRARRRIADARLQGLYDGLGRKESAPFHLRTEAQIDAYLDGWERGRARSSELLRRNYETLFVSRPVKTVTQAVLDGDMTEQEAEDFRMNRHQR